MANERHKPTTPGRPSAGASRQQTMPDQGLQSGSRSLDKKASGKRAKSVAPLKPPGAK
jgi:hypothetical protein